jgi:hypothetical protein
MLLRFIQSNFGEAGSVKSDSGSVANDDSWEEEFIKDSGIDSCESSAVGSLELSILFNPA